MVEAQIYYLRHIYVAIWENIASVTDSHYFSRLISTTVARFLQGRVNPEHYVIKCMHGR